MSTFDMSGQNCSVSKTVRRWFTSSWSDCNATSSTLSFFLATGWRSQPLVSAATSFEILDVSDMVRLLWGEAIPQDRDLGTCRCAALHGEVKYFMLFQY
jgi:hypothetical protein